MFPDSLAQHTENVRLKEQVRSLENQLTLPNGQTLAARIAELEAKQKVLDENQPIAREAKAKIAGLESTVKNLNRELQRRDEKAKNSTPKGKGALRTPYSANESPQKQKRVRTSRPDIPVYGRQNQARKSAERNDHELGNEEDGEQQELVAPEQQVVHATKKSTWRSPRGVTSSQVVIASEELFRELHYSDGHQVHSAGELAQPVKELLFPFLERFCTKEGLNSLKSGIKAKSGKKCAVARLYKNNETPAEHASCEYCLHYKLLCVEVNEDQRCIVPRPERSRRGLSMTDVAFWVEPSKS